MDQIKKDLVIIGGGPAGLSAAIYAQRALLDNVVLEQEAVGGQVILTSEVDNYPGVPHTDGYSLVDAMQSQVKDLGGTIQMEVVRNVEKNGDDFVVTTSEHEYVAKAVIVSGGATPRHAGFSGEKEFGGRGVSYCATCDGAFYRNKTVAVVGGGNTALEEALYLSLLCRTVYLIHRSDALTGEEMLQKRVSESGNIRTLFNTRILALHGSANLEYLELETSGQSSGYTEILRVDGLFAAIGQIPRNEIFSSVVGLDENGYIIADDSCHTGTEGIFAAGDCRTKQLRQLITAASDGAVAATEAIRFLNKQKNR